MMVVRNATIEDIPSLLALLTEVCLVHCKGRPDIFHPGQKYTADQITEILRDPSRPVYVACDGEKVVGSAFCQWRERGGNVINNIKTFFLDDLCVTEYCRGQGVGRLIFEKLKEVAKEEGAYNIELNVWDFDGGAVGFYEKLGMTTQRRFMEYII